MLFDWMRVHKDTQSAGSARALNAKAESVGHQGDEKRRLRPISQLGEGLYGKVKESKAGQAAASLPRSRHDFGQIPIHRPAAGPIQTELTINTPGDEYEQEADRVADRVMRTPAPQLQRKCACGGACPECQAEQSEEEDIRLQTKNVASGHLGQTVPPTTVHDALRSPGQPLDPGTRAFFEPRFGHGFGHVRVHATARAADSAQAVKALAYTVGRHVVFGHGQYEPNTRAGKELIAHELTHVIQQSGALESGAGESTNERCLVPNRQPTTVMIARQATPGWSDAPANDPNREVTTVDATGKITTGQVTKTQGVWRVPLEGLRHGLQKGDRGPAFESPKGRAVALIPNTVKPVAAGKDGPVQVDVLLHLHGYGVGYRQLRPGERDDPGVLKEGELRDVDLYQMEQQLLSFVTARRQLMIAVLPQGSEKSGFGDLRSKSDDYLKEVFAKLTPTFLPANVSPGRVILSAHSGGGPTAMEIARERKLKDVFLFDAINWSCFDEDGKKTKCKPGLTCKSNEFETVAAWVKDRIKVDTGSLKGTDDEKVAELKNNGTRFRGVTSESFTTKEKECASYGFWYKKLDVHIKNEINKLNVSKAVQDQLEKNYTVKVEKGQHERVMGGQKLEDALKD